MQVGESIKDLNHYVTMLIGIVQREEWEIREMKSNLRSIDDRLTSLEQGLHTRFGSLDSRIGALEARVGGLEGRMGALETHMGTFEQGVNACFEAQDKKLDQILLSLAALTPKPDQEA
jgi:chromosome segregation ATPase